jgi:KTSC domain-containing protein
MLTEKPYGSQAIERFAYDEGSRRLIVWFKSGGVYAYQDVARSTFDDFRAARSKGRFFQHEIRPRFVARRLSETEAGELDRSAVVAMGARVRFEIAHIGRCARVRVFF